MVHPHILYFEIAKRVLTVTANVEAMVKSQCFMSFIVVYHVNFRTLLAANGVEGNNMFHMQCPSNIVKQL